LWFVPIAYRLPAPALDFFQVESKLAADFVGGESPLPRQPSGVRGVNPESCRKLDRADQRASDLLYWPRRHIVVTASTINRRKMKQLALSSAHRHSPSPETSSELTSGLV